ncbi:DUF1800 domain-containing protein [uncultured Jatrophihabitans sp.]|uniref:DUF1800 domain-containing protein n=1 Tax=uncultured Jatrophihabitans sp. TaxID=1610747 RepID=UPI0035CCA904
MSLRVEPTIAAAIASARKVAVAPLIFDPVNHLLSRCSFGPTAYTRTYVAKYGPDAWYRQQVGYGTTYAGYGGNGAVAAQGPLLSLSPYDLRMQLMLSGNQYAWTAMDQLTNVTLGLQAWSSAQLYEVLVDFFSNHLNVANHNGDLWITRHTHDRDVVRPNAMGSFTDMLLASAKNPAMLTYLSLKDSNKTAVNENYGRELLELHTVGLHYTQSDVTNAARLLTGRTLDGYQHYLYDDYIHATGPVQVLGFTHPNSSATGGEKAGDALLRYLASHRYTAQNLARKLCVRLVSDNPSSDLVNAVAQAYLDSNTQILPMVSTILRSTEFWESRGQKVRRPLENILATVRVLGIGAADMAKALSTLHWYATTVGQVPLDWVAPNGYPDTANAWRSAGSLLALWNIHLSLAGGWAKEFKTPALTTLYGGPPANSGDAVDRMTQRITGMAWSAAHRKILQQSLNESSTTAMSRSALQWNLAPLIAIVLDSPHHALR